MDDQILDNKEENLRFLCPKCGEVPRDDVIFLCNTCDRNEIIEKDGVYLCPSCLVPGENFECMLCHSKDVKMEEKSK